MTAREHLQLFCRLKGFTGPRADAEVSRILDLISLSHVADNFGNISFFNNNYDFFFDLISVVSSFSGGMKRRLSVGISTIGNPSIIFMDVPFSFHLLSLNFI